MKAGETRGKVLSGPSRGEGGKIVERVRNLSAGADTEIVVEDGVAVVRGLKVSAG